MEDSKSKYLDFLEAELEKVRQKYVGKHTVRCATGLCKGNDFDFTDVKPEDISFSVHGEEYIKATAMNRFSETREVCYLKYVSKKATIQKSY